MAGGAGGNLQSLASNIGGMTGNITQNVPIITKFIWTGLNNISTHVNSAEFPKRLVRTWQMHKKN